MISLLFFLLGKANCMASLPWRWPSGLVAIFRSNGQIGPRYPDMSRISPEDQQMKCDLEAHFWAIKNLCERGDVSRLDFAKSVICVFRDQATEEKSLVDILCEQCGISVDDDARNELVCHCLNSSDLENIPVLVLDIPQHSIAKISASRDLCTNPLPNFCQAVMATSNVEEMAEVFDQFFDQFSKDANQEIILDQSGIYGKASIFANDIHRGVLKLIMREREFCIPTEIFHGFRGNTTKARDIFQTVLDCLEGPEIEGGAGLDEMNAFHVLKQVALAYRGQNGTSDGHYLVNIPFMETFNAILLLNFNGVEISMKFEDQDGYLTLTEKVENSPILGIQDVRKKRIIIPKLRFKFSGDPEIRTDLFVTSVREHPTDEVIEWKCPFREHLPSKIIFYGRDWQCPEED
jgi:hypothetical protein